MTDEMHDVQISVDPDATAMKLYSVPKGMQYILSFEGSTDRLEVVNPAYGRHPYIKIHQITGTGDAIELEGEEPK